MNVEPHLEPCPLCRSKLVTFGRTTPSELGFVRCRNCGLELTKPNHDAITVWNEREGPSNPQGAWNIVTRLLAWGRIYRPGSLAGSFTSDLAVAVGEETATLNAIVHQARLLYKEEHPDSEDVLCPAPTPAKP